MKIEMNASLTINRMNDLDRSNCFDDTVPSAAHQLNQKTKNIVIELKDQVEKVISQLLNITNGI